ncbi:MAG: hypothetical protein M0R46_06880 [Candidatus Muirbacterium halophilum]|nr:hypothetical protein [Candidatus Muirbacterium halophilum]
MKYLKPFNESTNISEIEAICEIYNITNYTINDDDSIDVNGDVDLSRKKLKELPLKFRKVSGDFYCSYNQLSSLVGCPQSIGGDFYCGINKLTSLVGSPQRVGGDFECNNNNLTSLEGVPKRVSGLFLCYSNKLKNIDYLPKYYKELDISNNPISKIINLFTKPDEYGLISNREDNELIMDFIDREMIQQDILLVNRLVEFLYDIDKPKTREELIELLKNDYTIR